MQITFELVFVVVSAVITGVLGTIFKDRVVPSRFIPIQNIVIGIIAAIVAVYFNLFDNIGTAILISLAVSLGVGGAYDAIAINKNKDK